MSEQAICEHCGDDDATEFARCNLCDRCAAYFADVWDEQSEECEYCRENRKTYREDVLEWRRMGGAR